MRSNSNDNNNKNIILDEDDEYIVEYHDGNFVSDEYKTDDVTSEIEHIQEEVVEEEQEQVVEYAGKGYSEEEIPEEKMSDNEDYDADDYDEDEEDYDADEYDDEEYYDDDEYYDEDEYDDEEITGFVPWVKDIIASFTVFDAVLGGTGVVLAVAVIVIISMFFQTKNVNTQIEAIAPLGEELSNIGIVGSEGLLAMAGSAYNGVFDDLVADEEEISTIDLDNESQASKVSVSFTSVEKDLKIRFTDANTGALITGTAFEVTLTNTTSKKQIVLTDSDMDGIIYEDNMTAGTYDAVITSTDKYKFPTTAQQVTVKDKVQYVVINNIQDEVKTEKQVDVAVEDTQKNDAAKEEETLKDTVEWVDPSQTEVSGSESYLLVDKSTIADPSQVSSNAYRMLFDGLSVSLDKTSLNMTVGGEETLTGTSFSNKTDDNKEYTYTFEWKSDNEGVATVSSGKVTAKSAGTAKITYTVTEKIVETVTTETSETVTTEISTEEYEKLSDEEKAKCTKIVEKVTENESETETSTEGEKATEKITGYKYEKVVKGSTSDKKETTNVGTATCTVTVEAAKATLKSSALELSKSSDSCEVGATLTVTAKKLTRTYSDNTTETIESNFPTIKWSSADTSIATVNESGVVTGVKAGKTKIKGTIEGDGGTSTEVDIEITEAKDLTLTLDRTSEVYLAVGSTTTLVATVTNYKSDSGVTWTTSNEKVATVSDKGVVTAVSAGSVTITATTKEKNKSDKNVTATCVVTVNSNAMNDKVTKLKDKNGNQIYIKNSDGSYVEAVYADYYTASDFYIKSAAKYTYTGWQTIDGKTYYFDKDGTPVTGTQIINGVTYNFGSDGSIASSVNGSTFGIDVSRHNGTIDWNAVKASGVDFVIIRCGYRGSSSGALIEDQNFKTNIKGATAAGLKVGVYVFSQAINEVEAVKEASLAVSLVKGYNLTYPIFIDTESSGGRADNIDKATRTAVVNAFCQTVVAGGYKAGIYASKTWFESKLNMSSVGNYRIWLAQYAATPTYKSKYDMWQYSSKGKISGINGNVDLNYSYLGY